MLYLFEGDDHQNRKEGVDSMITLMQEKRPEAQLLIFDSNTENIINKLKLQIFGIGLFDEKSIIKCLNLCEDKYIKDFILKHLEDLCLSPNVFILSEDYLKKTDTKQFERQGITVKFFDLPNKNHKQNLFYLGNLILQKNKLKLWISYQEELSRGVSVEEIMGIIVWQVKSLNIALNNKQTNSGLNPFVYSTCVKSEWGKKDADNLYKKLIIEYHESRRNNFSLKQRLERVILDLSTTKIN